MNTAADHRSLAAARDAQRVPRRTGRGELTGRPADKQLRDLRAVRGQSHGGRAEGSARARRQTSSSETPEPSEDRVAADGAGSQQSSRIPRRRQRGAENYRNGTQ